MSPPPSLAEEQYSDREGGRGGHSPAFTKAAVRAAWLLAPVFFLGWLYRDAFSTWFLADDFAWLSLLRLYHERHDLLHELFAPMAQGTIRPLSERGYFMVLESLFGLDGLPFHLVAFATAAADLLLIAWLTRRANGQEPGSRLAGAAAGIVWAANTALVRPMTWSSAYNELLCPLFLLSALVLFIRYADSGERGFWWWQLVVFSLGFGALEINIVYPALAAAWVIFEVPPPRRPALLRSLLPLAGLSAVYFAIHRLVAPMPSSGPYQMSFNRSMLRSLAVYWKWAMIPEPMERYGRSHLAGSLVLLLGSAAVAAFLFTEWKGKRYSSFFCIAWFVCTVAPLLPLTAHREDYYLAIPSIGIAIIGGLAAARYRNGSALRRAFVAIPLAAYLWAMVPVTRSITHWWHDRSLAVRTLVLGTVAARASHPGKAILLNGVTADLFGLSLAHDPFMAADVDNVYLTPESAFAVKAGDSSLDEEKLVPEPEALWHGITHEEVVVYSVNNSRLRNITEPYGRQLAVSMMDRPPNALPTAVDIGNPLYAWVLGPEWLPSQSGVRWMPVSATLRIGVPPGGAQLELEGFCPRPQLLTGPRHLIVLVDGVEAAETRIYDPETSFRRLLTMPAVLAGKRLVELEIRVDPVSRIDGQDYGLVFGKVAIRP
jgi:hypothetical protein